MEKSMKDVEDELRHAEMRYEIEQEIKFEDGDDSAALQNEEIDKKVTTLVDSVKELHSLLDGVEQLTKWGI